jgi:hypothetical protein
MSIEIYKDMLDQVFVDVVNRDGEELIFKTADGKSHKFYHAQDCCENVSIEDVCGDLSDLVGSPMLVAEQVNSEDDKPPYENCESYTWTFYKFATAKGSVTVRWLGTSNGYYSESVAYIQE